MFSIADIDKETRKRLYGQQKVSTVEDAQMSAGSPMFTEEDVHSTQHCLDIILRSVFVSKRISKDFFSAKCHEYALSQGPLPLQANTFGSNLMRTLVKGNITINRFLEALNVLGMTLADMQVTVKSSHGADEKFSVQETADIR